MPLDWDLYQLFKIIIKIILRFINYISDDPYK